MVHVAEKQSPLNQSARKSGTALIPLKKKIFPSFGSVAGASLLSLLASTACLAVFVNSLKGDLDVHDPVMAKDGGTFYVFWTGDYIPRKTSTDRITWKNAGTIFGSEAPSWFKTPVPDNNGKSIWAPDISFRDGMWWLYYSVSTFGSRVSSIGLATNATLNSADAAYGWIDQGMVINSTANTSYNCIDPNAFYNSDSTLWLVFGSWFSGIQLVQLNAKTGKLLQSSPTVTSLAAHSSGIEGAFLIKWKKYYYLFVSWDNCCKGVNSNYKIAVGRASAIKGPYVDKKNKTMTSGAGELLDTGDAVRKGPGHNGIFIEHDTVFCINHYYDATRDGQARMQIRPIYWDSEDWPSLQPTSAIRGTVIDPNRHPQSRFTARLVGGTRYAFGERMPKILITTSGRCVPSTTARILPMRIYFQNK
jgi:arabinan endo-1,5-alpha-L-arabinosidase